MPTASILRIQAERDYVRVHTADRSFLLRATLTGMAQGLDPSRFLRVHRSTVMSVPEIVGLRHLGAGAWAVIRGSGGVSPIGRSYLDEVRSSLGVRAPSARR